MRVVKLSMYMELISIFVLFLLYFVLFIACFWIIVFLDNMDKLWSDPKAKKNYSISVIIPAYNEEKSIKKSIKSVLAQDYPRELFELIVVNDGSTDNTKKICEAYERRGLLKLINKNNGGKAEAVNTGLKSAKNELIYILDADSFADKKSFKSLIGYFNNEKVAAVTSSMKVTSKKNFFEKIQWVEYLFSIFMRKIMSLFNCIYVTPGPGSIYRKRVLLEVGGFNSETLTEDMEVAFNIQNHDYVIENSLNSIVLTNTPSKLKDLVKQRRRWYTGFIEDSYSYKNLYFNKKKGLLGLLLPSNVMSTFTLLFLTFYSIFLIGEEIFQSLQNYKAVNFDFLTMFNLPNLSLSFYTLNVFSIIGVLFFFLSLITIYFSFRTSRERLKIRQNLFGYLSYLLFYSLLMTLFWTDSIIYKLFFRGRGKGWKYGE